MAQSIKKGFNDMLHIRVTIKMVDITDKTNKNVVNTKMVFDWVISW